MSVTGNDLLALGLPRGPTFDAALAEANRLHLQGAALETFVRAMMPTKDVGTFGQTANEGGLK